ncbi:hypothetical protein Hanom_Chr10g00896371 [Helianthus anomalus]
MASPSNPFSTAVVNPEPTSSPTAEEEAKVNASCKSLPVLRWTESSFQNLMTTIQMPGAYGTRYPQEGDTAFDAPAGYIHMFADWFGDCNLRLPLTVFVVEVLEYYNIHISQLSALSEFDGCSKGDCERVVLRVRVARPRALSPLMTKKRKGYASVAGGEKVPKFRKNRAIAVPKQKPASRLVSTGLRVYFPVSPTEGCDVEAQKKGGENPSIEVVSHEDTPPAVHAEQLLRKIGGDTIFDTLDSSNNLIDPRGEGDKGGEKPKSRIFEKVSSSAAAGKGVEYQPPIHPGETELDYYYCSYAAERRFDFHRPPWNILHGDEVMNDPSSCREALRGLGTPVETARACGLSCQNLQSWLAFMLVGGSIIANVVMEDYTALARREDETIRLRVQAEAVMKTAQEGVRTLAKLFSDERKLWKEACARENEKLFSVCQELNNLKVTNAALAKEKNAAEVAIKETETRGATAMKEAEARVAKELADANADRTKLNKVVEELQVELKSRVSILEEVTSHAIETEARARQAEETRDGLTTSLAQVTEDHAWIRQHGIGRIMETILDAHKNAVAVTDMNEWARWAGFKAGYNKCLNDVDPFCGGKFTDERSGFHGVDTEAAFDAAWKRATNFPLPPLTILKQVWKRKITWTVCACCLTRRERVEVLVVQTHNRLGLRAFFCLLSCKC